MSNDLNSVIVEGRLTRDPEVRYVPSGAAVASFSIATNKQTVQNGEKKEQVSYLDIVVWGKAAESCGQYLGKGDSVIVEGELVQRRWDDRETGQKRSKLEVVAKPFGVHFKGKKNHDDKPSAGDEPMPDAPVDDVPEDQIPF